ncbi:alpha-amylase family protein [Kribbella sp. NPDC026611]|uniref:alpha-amylase family protein n=1 Tax=Kribbella sp. NPDC026611 TaxID=3154911 RepID=UPI0033FD5A0C
MQRGVYFDAWFPRQHCYHPSLPPRRLRMVDDLVDFRATVLVWASMGGGSLSLPYLEQEAFGPVDARSRFYGFVNDSEFIAACHQQSIKVLGIVFEAQGWEFPVELSEEEDAVLALNELRGAGKRGWMGLREFSSNRYPKLWKPVEHYFPQGLVNSEGEPVVDLIEECVVRDIHQQPCHAHWVECPDREHQCYYMDRNNPVWREYLKAVIRIQIDAGVDGIQLDEAELPMGAFQYGACFCKDCMKGFRAYLEEHPPAVLAGVDLSTFHYGDWLLGQGYDFKDGRESTPLFGQYYAFQCRSIKKYFGELADYARAYARSTGREIIVSGNFFNLEPMYLALADDVDLVITEMRNTTYRQPEWYRYVAAFAGDKDVVVVENPYGGVIPELIGLLAEGKGHDLFRLSLFEAAALGANMSVPYGSWMGSVIEDSFYAPHQLATGIQAFLADHEQLFTRRTVNDVAVVFSVESTRELVGKADTSDNTTNARDESVVVPYRVVTSTLASSAVPFDVVIWADGVTAPDRASAEALARYSTVILPDVYALTDAQASAIEGYVAGGGTVVVTDRTAGKLPENVLTADHAVLDELLPHGRQVEIPVPVAANIQLLADGSYALHLLNYDYDPVADAVRAVPDVPVRIRLPKVKERATLVASDGSRTALAVRRDAGVHAVTLDTLGVYSIVVFHDGDL